MKTFLSNTGYTVTSTCALGVFVVHIILFWQFCCKWAVVETCYAFYMPYVLLKTYIIHSLQISKLLDSSPWWKIEKCFGALTFCNQPKPAALLGHSMIWINTSFIIHPQQDKICIKQANKCTCLCTWNCSSSFSLSAPSFSRLLLR